MSDTAGPGAPVAADEPAPAAKTIEDRVAALETRIEALIAELHRHVSLRLPDPPAADAPADSGQS